MIDRQAKHLTRLIDDLVDVNRITRDKLELRRERVDLADVVRAAVEARRTLGDEGRELTVVLPAEPIHLQADGIRLAQVLLNLLTNAVKYTKAGGRIRCPRSVTMKVSSSGSTDDGIGIAPDQLPHLFDMFYQADRSLERTQGGLGIGLTLARRLVELHGGTIEAKSEGLGRGCEITVRLPQFEEAVATASAAPEVVSGMGKAVVSASPGARRGRQCGCGGIARGALEACRSRGEDRRRRGERPRGGRTLPAGGRGAGPGNARSKRLRGRPPIEGRALGPRRCF